MATNKENAMTSNQQLKGHRDLKVYQLAYKMAMEIFQVSKGFPKEEKYSLTDQIRRSSRSVAANIAEGFRKRQYPKMFVSKLADADGEAAETQVWLDFARDCEYLTPEVFYHDRRRRSGLFRIAARLDPARFAELIRLGLPAAGQIGLEI